MLTFQTGDLIAKIHPKIQKPIQMGIVIQDSAETFIVKWTSFNKVFIKKKKKDIFSDLNKTFLLNTVQVHRENTEANLVLLNASYLDVKKRKT